MKLRDFGGVHMSGPVGELWLHGAKAGLVYEWTLDGWAAEWQLEAERYKLDPLIYANGTRETKVRLDIGSVGRFTGTGTIWTDTIRDGRTHRAIVIKGGNGQWQTKAPVALPSRSNS